MKKLICILALVLASQAHSSTLVIENLLPESYLCIHQMSAVRPFISETTIADYNFLAPSECYFKIEPGEVFTVSDNISNNRQFPFLQVFPFIGNIGGGGPQYPFLPTQDNTPNNSSGTRFVFENIKYTVKGELSSNGVGAADQTANAFGLINNDIFGNKASRKGILNQLPNQPIYRLVYQRILGNNYIYIELL